MERAVELIESTPLPFEEIAYRVGYADSSTLRTLILRGPVWAPVAADPRLPARVRFGAVELEAALESLLTKLFRTSYLAVARGGDGGIRTLGRSNPPTAV